MSGNSRRVHPVELGHFLEPIDEGLPMDDHSTLDFRNSALVMIPDFEMASSFLNPPNGLDGT